MKKPLEEEEILLQDGTIETSNAELKDTFLGLMSTITCCIVMAICLAIHRQGTKSLSRYRWGLNIHLETVQDQRSMSDGPVLKPTIRYVSMNLLTREQLISAQKEELALPCSRTCSVEEAANANVCYFMKD